MISTLEVDKDVQNSLLKASCNKKVLNAANFEVSDKDKDCIRPRELRWVTVLMYINVTHEKEVYNAFNKSGHQKKCRHLVWDRCHSINNLLAIFDSQQKKDVPE